MSGYLIPSSGGKAQPLNRSKMYLGRRSGDRNSGSVNRETAYCQLEFVDGWWFIEDLGSPGGLQVNYRVCKRVRLSPNDELTIGKYRFRIQYEAPRSGAAGRGSSRHPHASGRSGAKVNKSTGRGSLGRLIPSGGGAAFALSKPHVLIGRRPSCDVVLPYKTVSGEHCRLDLDNGYWHATDLGSHNGTWKNGLRCDEAWVHPRDQLSIAKYHFRIDYVPYGQPPDSDSPQAPDEIDGTSLLSKVGISRKDIEQILPDEGKRHLSSRIDLDDEDDFEGMGGAEEQGNRRS